MFTQRKIKVLVISIVMLAMTVGFSSLLKSNQSVFANGNSSVIDEASKSVQKWIQTMESPFYKNILVKPVLVKSNIQRGSSSYAIFNVNVQQVLKAQSPEELPMVKGMIECLNSKKPNLKQSQIDYANRKLGDQLKELREYINKTEELNVVVKVNFIVDANYNIKPNSIKFYVETPDGDTFLDGSILQPGTPEELEKYGFKRMEEIIEESKKNSLLAISSTYDAYDRWEAGYYADKYSSNPPDGEGNDQCEDVNGHCCWWDTTHWNNNEYQLSTRFYSDCADYVSQALHEGGIPMDSIHDSNHWWYDNSAPLSSYDYCPWVYVPALKNYMINHGYFWKLSQSDGFKDANRGCVAIKKDENHVVMITQNDTINRALSAHMSDRKHYWYSGSKVNPDGTHGYTWASYYKNNYDFYEVHYIIQFWRLSSSRSVSAR